LRTNNATKTDTASTGDYMAIEHLQKQLNDWQEKENFFQEQLIIAVDAAQKFSLKRQIEECETNILRLKKEMAEALRIDAPMGQEMLLEKIRALSVDQPMGNLHLVNCDRSEVSDSFWDAFEAKEDVPFQFYFILGCRRQMPPSFAERAIYEIISDELGEEEEAMNYLRRPDNNRLNVEPLELKNSLRRTQKVFLKQLAKRFELASRDFDLETFTTTGIPKMQEEYVATVYNLDSMHWKEEFGGDFFQWTIDTFSDMHDDCPHFLFFFVIYLNDFHDEPLNPQQTKIVKTIEQLVQNNTNACSVLTGLTPVEKRDVQNWIDYLGEHNVTKIDEVIETMVRGLDRPKQELFEQKAQLDMADVELLQELFYRIYAAEHFNT